MSLDEVHKNVRKKLPAFPATHFIECNLYGPRGYLAIGQ